MGYAARLGARSDQRARVGRERAQRAGLRRDVSTTLDMTLKSLPYCVDDYYGEGHDDGDDDEGKLKDLLDDLFALDGG